MKGKEGEEDFLAFPQFQICHYTTVKFTADDADDDGDVMCDVTVAAVHTAVLERRREAEERLNLINCIVNVPVFRTHV